ncbi:MAG: hypothetical protein JWP03_566 [Phycisphaerales bacterium]|jgi:hypothetical protein|nr:hypothetical protein [Phycisphaerales bacterium]
MESTLRLMESAYAELRTPHQSSGLGLRDVLFVLANRAFDRPWSMEIFDNPERTDQYSVAVALWDYFADFPDHEVLAESGHPTDSPGYWALHNSMLPNKPTIERSLHAFPREDVDAFLIAFSRHSFSYVPTGVPLFNVDEIEFRAGNTTSGVALRWWGEGPPQWHPAIAEIQTFIARLSKQANLGLFGG